MVASRQMNAKEPVSRDSVSVFFYEMPAECVEISLFLMLQPLFTFYVQAEYSKRNPHINFVRGFKICQV